MKKYIYTRRNWSLPGIHNPLGFNVPRQGAACGSLLGYVQIHRGGGERREGRRQEKGTFCSSFLMNSRRSWSAANTDATSSSPVPSEWLQGQPKGMCHNRWQEGRWSPWACIEVTERGQKREVTRRSGDDLGGEAKRKRKEVPRASNS